MVPGGVCQPRPAGCRYPYCVLRNVLTVAGRLFIAAGAVVLLFVAYQLWGTGLQTSAAQDRLAGVFDEQVAAVDAISNNAIPDGDTAQADAAMADAAMADAAIATLASLSVGDPIGRLEIPSIGVDFIVLEGVDLVTLQSGPGHFPQTPLPGQPGNSAIAGHRATYDEPFNLLNEVAPGDEVRVTTVQGTFTYEVLPQTSPDGGVYGHYIVEPTALEILDDKGDNRITLMGCHPRWGSSQRIVVEAALVSTPAPPAPVRVDEASVPASELLRGERGEWLPVLGWGAVVIALGLAAMFIGRRVTRWVVYPLAAPLVGIALFRSFEAISALSPVAL